MEWTEAATPPVSRPSMALRSRANTSAYSTKSRIGRLDVSLATTDCRDQAKIADAVSDMLQDILGKDQNPCRRITGVTSLPFGTSVTLELIFKLAESRQT